MVILDAEGNEISRPEQTPQVCRVVVCIPTRGECKSGFTVDLVRLVNFTIRHFPEISFGFMTASGLNVHDLRIHIAKTALDAEPDYLFWLDDDMRFPPDALVRLLGHQKDIVGSNYVTRTLPPRPTARNMDATGSDFWAVPSPKGATGLERVDGLGFGCMLTKASIFEVLEKPWFSMPPTHTKEKHIGEDVYFCVNARNAGFHTFLDHDLSRELRHVGSFEFTWAHFDELAASQEQEPSEEGQS